MKTFELIEHVNLLTDENLPAVQVVQFLNDAIADINTEVHANFPSLTIEVADDEPVIPEKWQRTLLVPFAAARVKQNDGSQFEYNDLYAQYQNNLMRFKIDYEVPLIYKDINQGGRSAAPDFTGNPYAGW